MTRQTIQAKHYQAFISHNSKDKPQVRRIVNELFSYFSIWFDQADMLYGEDWVKQITQGLKDSDVCVIFVGKNGIGPSQEKEIQLAKDLKIRICCAFLPGAVPEEIYEQLQISNTTMYSNYMEGESRIAFELLAASILGKPIGWEFLIGVKLQKRAEEWSNKKIRTLLYKDDELRQAQVWKKKHLDEISNVELAFLKASLDTQKARMISWMAAITFLLCIIGLLAIFGITRQPAVNAANTQSALQQAAAQNANATAKAEQERADEQNNIARAGQLADQANSLTSQNPIISLLLSIESHHMFENAQTYSVVRKNAHAYPQILRFINGTNYFESGRVSPDEITHSFGPGDRVSVYALSSDGKIIAFAVRNKIILQDVDSGKELQVLTLPSTKADGTSIYNYPYGLVFSPDSKFIASDSGEGQVILWEVQSGLVHQTLIGHEEKALVRDLAFSANGKLLASSSQNDDRLIVWDVSTGQTLCNIKTYHEASDLSFISQSDQFITNIYVDTPLDSDFNEIENKILVWDTSTCKSSVITFDQQVGDIINTSLSADGKTIALESIDKNIVVWNLSSNQSILTLNEQDYPHLNAITLGTDEKKLALGKDIVLWDLSSNQPIFTSSEQDYPHVTAITLSSDGRKLVIGYDDGNILIWDVTTKELEKVLRRSFKSVRSLLFNTNANTLISLDDKYAVLWDLSKNQNNDFILPGNQGEVHGVAFSPDGGLLASAGQDTNIIIWDVATKQQLCTLKGHKSVVMSVAFTSNSTISSSDLGSSDTAETHLRWDLDLLCPKIPTNRNPVVPTEHSDVNLYFERRDDGLHIINSSDQPIGNPLVGHPASTRIDVSLFNQNNELLATGGNDGTLMLWDVAGTSLLSALEGHGDSIKALAFSPDSKILASGSGDGTVRLWDIDLGSWLQRICQTAGRNFTIEEWNEYFPDEDYRITCPQWPSGQ